MGMYNIVFGENPIGRVLLGILGFKSMSDVGRYRDAFISEGKIAVYTRNGGGNREHWDEKKLEGKGCDCTGCIITHHLPAHPLYLSDRDDDFDCTYATVYFKFPPEFAEELKKLDTGEKFEPSKRWHEAIEALKASLSGSS